MKTKKIQRPFSVEEWRNGAKVETRDGRPVRILCTDMKSNYPIVAVVLCKDGEEAAVELAADGSFSGKVYEDGCDLVIVEEVEESERWADDEDAVGEGWWIADNARIGKCEGLLLNRSFNFNLYATERQAKSALAMARISQLMAHDERYGGVVTDEEWENEDLIKFVVSRHLKGIDCQMASATYSFLAFHTPEQRELFLSENEQLVRDYLMID